MATTEIPTKPSGGAWIRPSPSTPFWRRRSGYEPSDTESEWHDSPWNDAAGGAAAPFVAPPRSRSTPPDVIIHAIAPHASLVVPSRKPSPLPLRHGRLPHEPAEQQESGAGNGKNHSNHGKQRHVSPYRTMARAESRDLRGRDDTMANSSSLRKRTQSQRLTPSMLGSSSMAEDDDGVGDHFQQVPRVSEKSSSHRSRRSKSAPRPRDQPPLQPQQQRPHPISARRQGRSLSPLDKPQASEGQRQNPSAGEINETTDSIALDDIFFSREHTAVQKSSAKDVGSYRAEQGTSLSNRARGVDPVARMATVSSVLSRTNTSGSSHHAVSRHSSSGLSNDSSRTSDISSGNFRKFAANRQKNQMDSLFSCVRRGTCGRSKSPNTRAVDEASYIKKAFVVEELRQFWTDKHRPRSLSGFICHKQQAQQLQKLFSYNNCPHIILKGPPGSGKKSLALALVHDIFGDSTEKISRELRRFLVQISNDASRQEARTTVAVPLTSSPHHVELDIKSETKNAKFALMGLVKEIANTHAVTPLVSDSSFRAEYKVIVLYANSKVPENIQHLIKWVMDCHTDACKIVLCCEDENHIFESVRARCKLINVDAPETHEIVEVLLQIAKKESFELPMGFAVKIVTKSKQNLRKAIMALESCKAHRYPFVDEQPIPIGWEETLRDIASEVFADPSHERLFHIRGKLQNLLAESVHPKLILQKLVEEFLKGVQVCFRRELYYWHAHYEKRLPTGTTAQLKLEEFVAKFMSIQRRNSSPGKLAL